MKQIQDSWKKWTGCVRLYVCRVLNNSRPIANKCYTQMISNVIWTKSRKVTDGKVRACYCQPLFLFSRTGLEDLIFAAAAAETAAVVLLWHDLRHRRTEFGLFYISVIHFFLLPPSQSSNGFTIIRSCYIVLYISSNQLLGKAISHESPI